MGTHRLASGGRRQWHLVGGVAGGSGVGGDPLPPKCVGGSSWRGEINRVAGVLLDFAKAVCLAYVV